MQKYKSIKTFERLSKIHPSVPQYDLTTYKEINEKFEEIGIDISNNLKNQFDRFDSQDMNVTIQQLLKQWTDKVYMREKKLKEQDIAYEKETKNIMGQKQYKWLNLETKYDELRSKLRQIVVDKLNDYENQTLAMQALNARAVAKKSGGNPNNIKLMLTNVNIVNTRNIFENMGKFGQSNETHFLNSLGPDRLKKIKGKEKEDQSNSNSQHTQAKFDLAWTKDQEKVFRDQRQKSRKLFTNEVSSSNFNDLGFLPILQQLNLQEKKKLQREHILNKYADGEWLTAKELQFLANTSTLLNSCLDKDFFQNTTNIIDKELLQNLAENILCDYEEMRQATQLSRLKYIQKKMIVRKDKIQKIIVEDQKLALKQQNQEFNERYIRVFSTVIKHMDQMGNFEEKIPEDVPGAYQLQNYLTGKIPQQELINKMKYLKNDYEEDDYLNVGRSQQNMLKDSIITQPPMMTEAKKQSLRKISRPKSTLTPGFQKEITRHRLHPSSKLFIKQVVKDDVDDNSGYMSYYFGYLLEKVQEKQNIQESEKFHLSTNCHPALKISSHFCQFNSGGPHQGTKIKLFDNVLTIYTAREIRAVKLIQRKLRTVVMEKALRKQVQSRKKEIYYFYKDNCELMLNTIENEKNDQGLQSAQLVKQIEKAKQLGKDNLNIISNNEDERYNNQDHPEKQTHRRFALTGESTKNKRSQKSITTSGSTKAPSSQTSIFINQKNHLKQDQLLIAAKRGQLMMILQSKFVYSASDINIQNKEGDTALHMVVDKSEHEFIQWYLINLIQKKRLIDGGANPNIANNLGNTSLHNAFKKDKYDIIMMLINCGADLSQINYLGQTPHSFSSQKMIRLLGLEKEILVV